MKKSYRNSFLTSQSLVTSQKAYFLVLFSFVLKVQQTVTTSLDNTNSYLLVSIDAFCCLGKVWFNFVILLVKHAKVKQIYSSTQKSCTFQL